MKLMRPAALATALLIGLSTTVGAVAQPPEEEDTTLVSGVLIVAERPGPAFWKVSDADSTVWVLGVPSALPRGQAWKKDDLKTHLTGANVLIVGSGGVTVNPFDIIRLMFTTRRFRADRPLDQTLDPDLLARMDKAYTALDAGNLDRVHDLKPGYAAFLLSGLFQRSLDMQSGQPEKAILREAFLRVKTERVGRSGLIDMLRLIEEMPQDTASACIEDALAQVDAGPERALGAADGWAHGDLRMAISAERGFERCLSADPEITAATDANNTEVVGAILAALDTPGKSVAVVDLRPLLSKGGILERLGAYPQVTLTAPDAPGLDEEIEAEALGAVDGP